MCETKLVVNGELIVLMMTSTKLNLCLRGIMLTVGPDIATLVAIVTVLYTMPRVKSTFYRHETKYIEDPSIRIESSNL